MIIDGKKIAEKIYKENHGIHRYGRYLAIVSNLEDPASQSFIAQKKKAASRLGVEIRESAYSSDTFKRFSVDTMCGGMVLQLPLAAGIDADEIVQKIPPRKDVDNLTTKASVPAPAVAVVEAILSEVRPPQTEAKPLKDVAIIGQGRLVGRPVAKWAQGAGAEKVSVYNIGFNPNDLKTADLVVSGAGATHIFSAEHLKVGAIVIDFGYPGDFDATGAEDKNIAYTPTPGGTGPILVACLMRNFCDLNRI
ncbi:hypothetical protein A2755_03945 [Candidatus Wolfebacteria bacterium RIFCSPHIGHO2_01_FULL_48_22]|uniref:Tetrahydrofolate dehydrogenase/cyclohydrolase NAD(P)-binding domain-containing protein n=2 Tax=Candidatus Wolfeibacteriota TaxID=1752735 RepID=A0A1F8DNY1_9BACT|nr:MAG: hypothetical protein A2755_03945 [Candidatus Wolfebacteria bacterium RIFCSPHIGHO2_01_FULL_48_22]OGM93490.1 MAG: hypothetical protein A2935_01295 [Candidatus Wolfebacteria bacterium RIFCSPLOWO2_01_FULL_47_17b]